MGHIPRSLYALAPTALVLLAACTSTKPDAAAATRSAGARAADSVAVMPATTPSPGSSVEPGRITVKAAAGAAAAVRPALADGSRITVYKNPTCECCEKWVDHLREHGFEVVVHVATNLDEVKANAGVPNALATCHTALVGGYVVEGHVPADVVQRLLRERPAVVGLAVPGMPRGVPGMDGPVKDRYDVIAFARDGASRIYESR